MSNPLASVSDDELVGAYIEAEKRAAELTSQVHAIADIWSRYQQELVMRHGISGMARLVDDAYAGRRRNKTATTSSTDLTTA